MDQSTARTRTLEARCICVHAPSACAPDGSCTRHPQVRAARGGRIPDWRHPLTAHGVIVDAIRQTPAVTGASSRIFTPPVLLSHLSLLLGSEVVHMLNCLRISSVFLPLII